MKSSESPSFRVSSDEDVEAGLSEGRRLLDDDHRQSSDHSLQESPTLSRAFNGIVSPLTGASDGTRPDRNGFLPRRSVGWKTRTVTGLVVTLVAFALALFWVSLTRMSAPEGVRPTPPSQRTVILISLDGFRAEYLSRGLTPNLQALVASGVRAPYMLPSFPTETFPNHYTLVTGLYPARHGIVANEFYDPDAKRTFSYVNASDNKEEMWWEGGEPIWIAAERGGLRSACIMWPGSEAPHKGRVPSYIVPYQSHVSVASKAEIVLGWLALDPPKRPSLITLYVPEVDSMGHTVGPDDALLNTTLVEVDGELGKLFDAVDQRGYGDRVDTVIVSDHGMASTSLDRVIYLSDFVKIDPSWIIRLNPLLFLYPPDESTLRQLHTALTNASKSTDPPLFSVWLRDEIPFPFHYRNNSRIPPLLLAPRVGWLFGTSRDEHEHGGWFPLGMHGYTNEDDRMRAIFLAKGPRFRKGAVVEPFANVDVYGLVAGLLGIEGIVPPNNSTDWRKVFGDVVLLD